GKGKRKGKGKEKGEKGKGKRERGKGKVWLDPSEFLALIPPVPASPFHPAKPRLAKPQPYSHHEGSNPSDRDGADRDGGSHPDLSLLLVPSPFPSCEPPIPTKSGIPWHAGCEGGDEDTGLSPGGGDISPEGVSPLAGDVHVGMADRNGQLEVDVIQARGLIPKMGSKCIPGRWLWREGVGAVPGSPPDPAPQPRLSPFPTAATYVKVYLLENGVCLAKKKTKVVKKTCDPSYQQPLLFEESPQGKVLQPGWLQAPSSLSLDTAGGGTATASVGCDALLGAGMSSWRSGYPPWGWDVLLEVWDVLPEVWDVLLEVWDVLLKGWDVLLEVWDVLLKVWDVLLEVWDVLPADWDVLLEVGMFSLRSGMFSLRPGMFSLRSGMFSLSSGMPCLELECSPWGWDGFLRVGMLSSGWDALFGICNALCQDLPTLTGQGSPEPFLHPSDLPGFPPGHRFPRTPSPLPCPQVIVWGDYGRMDHKCFMGMAQIILEELDLSSAVSGWYKLFPTSSLADSSIGPLTRRLSQSSLESSTSPSCP
ncbi:hypothetical protein DV515_00017603, partial [Chloebia gouldiae]